jgi:hypothetical protein
MWVVISGYVVALIGVFQSDLPSVVFGCFLVSIIVWGER